jgi:hypothetical protein
MTPESVYCAQLQPSIAQFLTLCTNPPTASLVLLCRSFRSLDRSLPSGHPPPQSTYTVHLQYNSVCPSSELGPPPHPLSTKWGGTHSPADEGVGGPNSDDWRKRLALCLLYATLYSDSVYRNTNNWRLLVRRTILTLTGHHGWLTWLFFTLLFNVTIFLILRDVPMLTERVLSTYPHIAWNLAYLSA